MKFNSQSVTLNRGVNLKVDVVLPPILETYVIPEEVWSVSIDEFNKELDQRSQVSEIIKGIKVDVLRIHRSMGNVLLWMMVKEHDIDMINALTFTLRGKVVFEDDKTNKVERVLIKDLLYSVSDTETKSIFKKKELTNS